MSMGEPQPIRFSVPEDGFDLSLLPEAARQRGSEAFREAVTRYYKDAYREAGGRVDVAFTGGEIEVAWEPQADQLPASATINSSAWDPSTQRSSAPPRASSFPRTSISSNRPIAPSASALRTDMQQARCVDARVGSIAG